MDSNRFNDLRAKALELLSTQKVVVPASDGEDIKNLIEELSIHQIELEYQNEELTKAQQELQKTSDMYAELFNNAPIGYLVLNRTHTIVDVNERFCAMLRMEKEEIVSNDFERYVSPLYQDTFYHFFRSIERIKDTAGYVELKLRIPRSEEIAVSIHGIKRRKGEFYQLAISDISSRKKLEERLRIETEKAIKNETYFRQIVERSSDVFYYQNTVTHRLDYISPTIANLLGYTQDECLGMSSKDILGLLLPEYREGYLNLESELMNAELEGRHAVEHEFKIATKDNHMKWVHGIYTLIKDNFGHSFQVMCTLHDVTIDREYSDFLLTAKEKAEENNSFKSKFLANICHELKTPLNAIIGFSDILKESYSDNLDEDARGYLDIVLKSGQSMLEFSNEIMYLSKIEASQMELNNTYFDLTRLMQDLNDVFKLEAKQKGLELRCTIGTSPQMILGDKDKIHSCMQNLIKNALKYTKEGFVEFNASVADDVLTFTVVDSGIGIPEDKKNKIFERFKQIDNASYDGVGLGLSIVQGLLNIMGGDIQLVSESGEGSTFSFTIPVNKQ